MNYSIYISAITRENRSSLKKRKSPLIVEIPARSMFIYLDGSMLLTWRILVVKEYSLKWSVIFFVGFSNIPQLQALPPGKS